MFVSFLLRDAVLVRAVPRICTDCLSLCLSQIGILPKRLDRITEQRCTIA